MHDQAALYVHRNCEIWGRISQEPYTTRRPGSAFDSKPTQMNPVDKASRSSSPADLGLALLSFGDRQGT